MGRKKSSGGDSGAAARAAAEASRKAAEAAERAAREREERARQEFQQSLARVKSYTGQTAQQFVEGAKGELATTLGDMTSKYEKQLAAFDPDVSKGISRLQQTAVQAQQLTNLNPQSEFQKYLSGIEGKVRKSTAGGQNLGFQTSDL